MFLLESRHAFGFYFLGHRIGQGVGRRAFHRRIGKTAGAVNARLINKIEQLGKFFFCFAGEADDKGAAQRQIGANLAPLGNTRQGAFGVCRAAHGFQNARVAVLQGNIKIGREQTVGHQRNQIVNAGIGIDIMQAYPRAHLPQFAREFENAAFHRLAAPEISAVFNVGAVGGSILGDDQQFLDPGINQILRFRQHFARRAALQTPAHGRNNAERTMMIAAFGDFQIGIMARSELQARGRNEIGKGLMRGFGHMRVYRAHHRFIGLRAGNGEHAGMQAFD